jgi:hypothetical protein
MPVVSSMTANEDSMHMSQCSCISCPTTCARWPVVLESMEVCTLLMWGPEAESYPANCRGSMQQPNLQWTWGSRCCWVPACWMALQDGACRRAGRHTFPVKQQ